LVLISPWIKKNYPPGQHGQSKKRSKQSEYAIQLQEKQKAKYTYGILERQFARIFDMATRSHGITGEVLLQLIESRLDNVVYRMGIAPTRRAARQLVSHAHINVNGKTVNIPSFILKPGDVVAVRERSRAMEMITSNVLAAVNKYPWMDFDKASMSGTYMNRPERSQIPENIREQLIVELYSK